MIYLHDVIVLRLHCVYSISLLHLNVPVWVHFP